MNCPYCHSENEESKKFCSDCGAKLQMTCPRCSVTILPGDKFCGECGHELAPSPTAKEKALPSERKHITALFADISGYTTMAERLDPEEVKDITVHLMGRIALVISKYEGFIGNFSGDQVMALFGIPLSHEDDPARALKAAMEIHRVAGETSLEYQGRIGQPIAVHIGINSGLVVTGAIGHDKLERHVAGDAINVASRLCSLAKVDETLVGQNTYALVEGFFSFEPLEPVMVKGKTRPVPVYRFLGPKEVPTKTHRISGLRADFTGRKEEMAILEAAIGKLLTGKGSAIFICGEAGTGKSRLIEEFKANLDLNLIKWMEGHAYAYTQNTSYYPIINLIIRDLDLTEEDTPEKVAEKLEARVREILSPKEREEVVPYLGDLLSLYYPEVAGVGPEFWKSRLHHALLTAIMAQTQQVPTVICFEDLHWADPSSLEFLRFALMERWPTSVVICTYRPPLKIFSRQDIGIMAEWYQEIQLQELSLAEIQAMVASILKTTAIPERLLGFIQEKVGGNPFYLEETINSLVESGILMPEVGGWRLTRAVRDPVIPSTVHAVISGRIDRLDEAARHLLQEASVIGRTLPYEILKRITGHADSVNRSLAELELLDLLRTSPYSEQEYIFKHALIQEVAYNTLLKKDRQGLHQRIGLVMEEVFKDRLPEFYESLAHHFKHSDHNQKALYYLIASGRKSLKKYAVEVAHQYYKEAFQILVKQLSKSAEEKKLLLDFLNEWAQVFYYRGDFKGFTRLFLEYKELAESIDDKARLGTFYAWLGFALFSTEKTREAYDISIKAIALGEEIGNYFIIGLAYANLAWCCAELKLMDQAIQYSQKAKELVLLHDLEPMALFQALAGVGLAYMFMGNTEKNLENGRIAIEYGESHSNLRSIVVGHIITGYGYYSQGDFPVAMEYGKRAVELLNDPLFSEWPKMFLCMNYIITEQLQEAETLFREIIPVCNRLGLSYILTPARALLGAVLVGRGQISRGIGLLEEGYRTLLQHGRFFSANIIEFTLGEIYFRIATLAQGLRFRDLIKNLGFIVKKLPFARRRAETHLKNVIEVGREIGAQGILQGQALLNLGILHHLKGKRDQARACLAESLHILEHCKSEELLKRAQEALAAVG